KELGFNQYEKLDLRPWHYPAHFLNPVEIAEILAAGPDPNDAQQKFQAATLAKRLIDAGLSLYEPDPERALNDRKYRQAIKARVRAIKARQARSAWHRGQFGMEESIHQDRRNLMPLIQVRVIKDVFSKQQKHQMISKLTDAMVSIEGENMRGVTW